MKKILITTVALFSFMQIVFAQEAEDGASKRKVPDTLFSHMSSGDISVSGYGAPVVRFGKAGDKIGTYCGLKGGVILDDNWLIGFSGFGLVHPTKRSELSGNDYNGLYPDTAFGYGGFLIEYVFSPKSLLNFSVGSSVGGGGLSFYKNNGDDEDTDHEGKADKFFAVEPELNIFINVTRFCKIGAGISYRYVKGIDSIGLDDKDFRGFNASIQASFGWF